MCATCFDPSTHLTVVWIKRRPSFFRCTPPLLAPIPPPLLPDGLPFMEGDQYHGDIIDVGSPVSTRGEPLELRTLVSEAKVQGLASRA